MTYIRSWKLIRKILATACSLSFFFLANGQVFEVNEIMNNGSKEKLINLVFMGDGYTAAQQDQFISDANSINNQLFETTPFKEYKQFFNSYAIQVISNESGTNHPKNANDEPSGNDHPAKTVDNFFGSTFDFAGIHRLLAIPNNNASKVSGVLASNLPEYDQAFIIVNSEFYGGSGGSTPLASTHNQANEIAIHEVGHSFARLTDEYSFAGGGSSEAPNATQETTRNNIKWRNWIENTTPIPTPSSNQFDNVIGLFEGAAYQETGWFRPKNDCKMRSLGVDFCAVCTERFVEEFHIRCNPILSTTPSQGTIAISTSNKVFSLDLATPEPNDLSVIWKLDGNAISQSMQITLNPSILSDGTHTLEAVVEDKTDFLRLESSSNILHSAQWTLNKTILAVGDDELLVSDLIVYPNPFKNHLELNYKGLKLGEHLITLMNFTGQIIWTKTMSVNKSEVHTSIDLLNHSLSDGGFIIQINDGQQVITQKLLRR